MTSVCACEITFLHCTLVSSLQATTCLQRILCLSCYADIPLQPGTRKAVKQQVQPLSSNSSMSHLQLVTRIFTSLLSFTFVHLIYSQTYIRDEKREKKESSYKIIGARHESTNYGLVYGKCHFDCQFHKQWRCGVISTRTDYDCGIQNWK